MMKKLQVYMLKSFLGPFVFTFFIALFILLLQFLWKYLDDLVGKGLDNIPVSIRPDSLDAAEEFADWFSAQLNLGGNTVKKPQAKSMPYKLTDEDIRKRESDRFLKNLFPWIN